ncbi:MAG: 5'-3' exonuclease [Actinomycetota bacterium]|nr:5'-3' exonuclease [Actinomycetota bacterium]
MTRMLVDAAGLYFRAFYAVPDSVTTPDGRPINAVRGFLDMAASLIDKRRPTRWVACLDLDWRPAFRVDLIPTYKAHRVAKDGGEDVPDKLSPQVPLLLEVLTAFGLACSGADGFEADDVIATLAGRDAEPVEVVTGDRDLIALATERVTVLYTGRGLAKMEVLGPVEVLAKYGIPARNYADFAILRGDPSDGLPGVAGVGEKTAAALVSRFGAIEDIVAAAKAGDDGFPSGAAGKVRAAFDYLQVAPAAVRGRLDVPLYEVDDDLPATPRHPERLAELAAELGIEAPVGRMTKAIALALS